MSAAVNFWISMAMVIGGSFTLGVMACMQFWPAISQADERRKIEREAQAASWHIHRQATAAFGSMLQAARTQDDTEAW